MRTGYGGTAPSIEQMKRVLDYNPATGAFTWKIKVAHRVRVGDIAGTVATHRYRLIRIDNRAHYAHHLAWLWMHGEWPTGRIDHENRQRDDNRIANLRAATHALNIANQESRLGASGYRGVWPTPSGRSSATMSFEGRRWRVGTFDTAEQAARAWDRACLTTRGEFAVTNFPKEQYA